MIEKCGTERKSKQRCAIVVTQHTINNIITLFLVLRARACASWYSSCNERLSPVFLVCVCVCVCVWLLFYTLFSVCNVVMFLRPVSASFRCVFNISGLSQHPRLRSVRLTTRLLHDPLPVFSPSVQVDVRTEGLSKHTHLWSWPLESLCTQLEVSVQHLKMTKPSTLSRLSVSHHASCSGKKITLSQDASETFPVFIIIYYM